MYCTVDMSNKQSTNNILLTKSSFWSRYNYLTNFLLVLYRRSSGVHIQYHLLIDLLLIDYLY